MAKPGRPDVPVYYEVWFDDDDDWGARYGDAAPAEFWYLSAFGASPADAIHELHVASEGVRETEEREDA